MSIFKVLADLVEMPVRIIVDVAKAPVKIMDGDDRLLEQTSKGIKKIEEDLED